MLQKLTLILLLCKQKYSDVIFDVGAGMLVELPRRKDAPHTTIYVETAGDSSLPKLIMLPGGPGGNATVYGGITASLSKYFHVIRFAPRGCGSGFFQSHSIIWALFTLSHPMIPPCFDYHSNNNNYQRNS